jgi:hypothetical protein
MIPRRDNSRSVPVSRMREELEGVVRLLRMSLAEISEPATADQLSAELHQLELKYNGEIRDLQKRST